MAIEMMISLYDRSDLFPDVTKKVLEAFRLAGLAGDDATIKLLAE